LVVVGGPHNCECVWVVRGQDKMWVGRLALLSRAGTAKKRLALTLTPPPPAPYRSGITEEVEDWRADVPARFMQACGMESLMFEAADPKVFSW
jgi:hypothetical protein